MKKYKYILFTAGRGPIECMLAVQGIQRKFKEYLDEKKIAFECVKQSKGPVAKSIQSIVFRLDIDNNNILIPWIGSIQWICKSPLRRYHKRKNWFIKCIEVSLSDGIVMDKKEVIVQTYRASGPGGQHRNKVETAIRLTHKPTGIVVTASESKSQLQNKKKAWSRLHQAINAHNKYLKSNQNLDNWIAQIEIERGNPIKSFQGNKFIEEK